ncbi:MAG TPA: hypothetical protein VGT99_13760 [Gammaproteobacteria bacterium]|nr:hypothetical protein [Gammaproteobacteria bacterium]
MNRTFAIVFAAFLAMGASTLALADGTTPAAPQAQAASAASAPAAKQTRGTQKGVHKTSKARRGGKNKKTSTPPAQPRK